ncbi:MAG: GSCFA domain-containing protein [Beijerinckiaceae bacterium]
MSQNPYRSLPDHRFWRKAIAGVPPFAIDPLVSVPFEIRPCDKVATAGSCFAQNIAKALQASGFHYFVPEGGPPDLSDAEREARNFGVYSARYGNIYTTRQLLQLFDRAYGTFEPVLDVWRRPDGRVVDPFRPQIEPDGFDGPQAMREDREHHLAAVRAMFEELDVFVFTFGLTETWLNKQNGAAVPLAPGVAGGTFDDRYEFRNMRASEVVVDFLAFVERLYSVNPKAKIVVTVSPVPLIATYVDRHVLVSNCYSKAALRVAAEEVVAARPEISYFPSYEIVTAPMNGVRYFAEDQRSITASGVQNVMRVFFAHYTSQKAARPSGVRALKINVARELAEAAKVVCDEEAIERA